MRVRRVLSADGGVLFDVRRGRVDPRVEATIDEMNSELLDRLLNLTGDAYMEPSMIDLGRSRGVLNG